MTLYGFLGLIGFILALYLLTAFLKPELFP